MFHVTNVFHAHFTGQYVKITSVLTYEQGKFHRTGEYKTGVEFSYKLVKSILDNSRHDGKLQDNVQVHETNYLITTRFI